MNKLLSIIKSLFLNIRLFGLKNGIKCPIFINSKVKVSVGKNVLIKLSEYRFGIIRIGWGVVSI